MLEILKESTMQTTIDKRNGVFLAIIATSTMDLKEWTTLAIP
jgi:hypothetical protein